MGLASFTARTRTELFTYCIVGGCGFGVEAAVIAMLQYGWGWGALPCRAVSFPTAVLVTWWLHHRYTVRSRGGPGELGRHLISQSAGLLTNLAVYAAMILVLPYFDRHALVPLVAGSAAGLVVNFVLSKHFVFIRTRG